MNDKTVTYVCSIDKKTFTSELECVKHELALRKSVVLAPRALSLKVSGKGALSVYGMGRFPVTLYREQWTRLLGEAERIKAFIADNESALKTKEQQAVSPAVPVQAAGF